MNPIAIPISGLKPALAGLGKIINRRLTQPVLGCIRIERTSAGRLELSATDLDSTVTVQLDSPVQGDPLVLLIPYADLSNIAKSCGKHESLFIASPEKNRVAIRFPVGEQMLEHRCESLPVEEFPVFGPMKGESIAIDRTLQDAIQNAFGCASEDPTRPILNGVFLDVSRPQGHYLVATDGRHLFSSNSFKLPLKDSLVIPNHRFLGWKDFSNDGEWRLRASVVSENEPSRFEIASNRWRFMARSIEGNYPNWRAVVPESSRVSTSVSFDLSAISKVIQTIAKMPDHDTVHHSIGLETCDNRCWLLGKSPNAEHWTRIEVVPGRISGPNVKVFLNRHLLAKALRFGLTQIDIIDPATPLRFSNGGQEMIIMPIHPPEGVRTMSQPERATVPQPLQTTPSEASNLNPVETKPMSKDDSCTEIASSEKAPLSLPKPALDLAISHIETLKGCYRDALRGLNELGDLLKQAAREQRTNEKEVHTIRQTLRSLQSVRI